jgi:hypothetical protein
VAGIEHKVGDVESVTEEAPVFDEEDGQRGQEALQGGEFGLGEEDERPTDVVATLSDEVSQERLAVATGEEPPSHGVCRTRGIDHEVVIVVTVGKLLSGPECTVLDAPDGFVGDDRELVAVPIASRESSWVATHGQMLVFGCTVACAPPIGEKRVFVAAVAFLVDDAPVPDIGCIFG